MVPGVRPGKNVKDLTAETAANVGAGPVSDGAAVERSYERCREVARKAASNFYYAFYMLPRPKRDALCAIYAFMRLVDDASDSPAASTDETSELVLKRAALSRWRALLDECAVGNTAGHFILPAFADTIKRYKIPSRYFHDLISGAEMDLLETDYATFESLQEYCYRVAGTVGLTCIHIFGFQDAHAPELAERLGIAFQLTNILRDVRFRPRDGPSVPSGGGPAALRVHGRGTGAWASYSGREGIASIRSATRLGVLSRRRPADRQNRPGQPRSAMGVGAHLQQLARSHRGSRF